MSNAINKKRVTLVRTFCNGIQFWIHTFFEVCSYFGNVENKYTNIINHCRPSNFSYGAFQTIGLQLIFTPKGLLGTNYMPRIILDTMT